MKLRNKEHRDIIADFQGDWSLCDFGDKIVIKNLVGVSRFEYTSLEQLAKEWVTVKEPLLKGDLRLAIKIWAEQCGAKLDDTIKYYVYDNFIRFKLFTEREEGVLINYDFELPYKLPILNDCKSYTLEDLVGTE